LHLQKLYLHFDDGARSMLSGGRTSHRSTTSNPLLSRDLGVGGGDRSGRRPQPDKAEKRATAEPFEALLPRDGPALP
jgi:hypothetical protein